MAAARRRKTRPKKWPGGEIRYTKDGRSVHWIRRTIGGVPYKISTRCTTLTAAMKELERFEKDPAGYRPGGEPAGEPLHLTDELVEPFLAWSLAHGRTKKHVRAVKNYLAWWAEVLEGVDLRHPDLLREYIIPGFATS